MATPKHPPVGAEVPPTRMSGMPLLGEHTVLRRNSGTRPVPGILAADVLKVYGLVGEQIAAPDLRGAAQMDDAALGAVLAELVERGLLLAEVVKPEDPLDLDFTSPEVLEKLHREAERVRQAEAEARHRVEAERKAKQQAEARVRAETEAKARADADAKANAAALARLKAEKIARAQSDSEISARQGALQRAEQEARARADTLARAEAEARARTEAVRKAEAEAATRLAAVRRMEAELKGKLAALARLDAERKQKATAEAKARDEAAARARDEAMAQAEGERQAREAAESQAAAERKARQEAEAAAEAERLARRRAEEQARAEQERKAREKTEAQLRSQIEALAGAERQAREEARAAGAARQLAEARVAAAPQPVSVLSPANPAASAPGSTGATAASAPGATEAGAPGPALRAGDDGRFEERLSAATLFGASDDDTLPRVLQVPEALLADAAPAARSGAAAPEPRPPAAPASADPSPVLDAAVRAGAASPAIEDAEAKSRLAQERFSRELEAQLARVTAEQAPRHVPGSRDADTTPEAGGTGKRERAESVEREQTADLLKAEEKRAKAEAERRLLAEEESRRRAREAATIASRARAEREKFERERERQRKVAEAEAQALARSKARAEQAPASRWKLYGGGALLMVAIIVGLFEVLPFNLYLSRVEQAMSDALGERVVVKSMHASLIPRPNIRLTDVTIGTAPGGATIASVRAVPTLPSLFRGPLTFKSVQLETVTVAPAFIPKLPDVVGMGGRQTLGFERILIRDLRLSVPNLELPPAEVEVSWNADGTFERASILAWSRRVSMELLRGTEQVTFRMAATDWQPLAGSSATIDQLKMSGTIGRNGLVASEVEADLYGGRAQGSFNVGWGADSASATARGEFQLRRLDVATLLPAMTANATAAGQMDGNLKFSLRAPTLRQLFDAPQVTAAFTIRRGWIGGIDLARLLRNAASRGGRTAFDEWTGVFAVSGSRHSLRQMQLTSGPMTASGIAEIDADGVLTGRINAQLSTGNGTAVRSSFSLGGRLQNIEVGN
jgi:hypothetical protein